MTDFAERVSREIDERNRREVSGYGTLFEYTNALIRSLGEKQTLLLKEKETSRKTQEDLIKVKSELKEMELIANKGLKISDEHVKLKLKYSDLTEKHNQLLEKLNNIYIDRERISELEKKLKIYEEYKDLCIKYEKENESLAMDLKYQKEEVESIMNQLDEEKKGRRKVEKDLAIKEKEVVDLLKKLNDYNEHKKKERKRAKVKSEASKEISFSVSSIDTEHNVMVFSKLPTRIDKEYDEHGDAVSSISFNSTGSIFATGSIDNTIRLWSAKKQQVKKVLKEPMGGVYSMDMTRGLGALYLIAGYKDSVVRVWDVKKGIVKHVLYGHRRGTIPTTVKFSFDNTIGISGGTDMTVRTFELNKGSEVNLFSLGSTVNSIDLLSKNEILSGHMDRKVRLIDTKSGEVDVFIESKYHKKQITSVQVLRNYLLTNSMDSKVRIFDTRYPSKPVHIFSHRKFNVGHNLTNSVFSPDSSYVASGGSAGRIFIWNVLTGKMERMFQTDSNKTILKMAWSPKGTLLLASDRGNKLISLR